MARYYGVYLLNLHTEVATSDELIRRFNNFLKNVIAYLSIKYTKKRNERNYTHNLSKLYFKNINKIYPIFLNFV